MDENLLTILAWIVLLVIGGGLITGFVYVIVKEWETTLGVLASALVGFALLWAVFWIFGRK